jgi:hypothetical protein
MPETMHPGTRAPNPLLRAWRGGAGLGPVFWILGVLGNALVWGVYLLLLHRVLADLVSLVVVSTAVGGFTLYAAVSIWRCASAATWPGWAYPARAFSVVTCLLAFSFIVLMIWFWLGMNGLFEGLEPLD